MFGPARLVVLVCAGLAATLGSPGQALGEIGGVASVIDGDTLEIHSQRIRLHGIGAPESSQTCLDDAGQKWRCGQQAALALQDLIGCRTVTRDERDFDRYGREISRCLVGEIDTNEWLVAQGLGLAHRRYSRDYVAAEEEARADARGVGRHVRATVELATPAASARRWWTPTSNAIFLGAKISDLQSDLAPTVSRRGLRTEST